MTRQWWDHAPIAQVPASDMGTAPDGVRQEAWDYAGQHADLGVGHVWTEVRCPAYRTLEPEDCTCGKVTP